MERPLTFRCEKFPFYMADISKAHAHLAENIAGFMGCFPMGIYPIQDGRESSPDIARRNGDERSL
jgi:hypothetical protein